MSRDDEIWTARTRDRQSIEDIASVFGLSRSRVSQIIHERDIRWIDRQRVAQAKVLNPEDVDSWPIEALCLSARALNCLLSENVRTIGRLREMAPRDLLSIKNLGRTTFHEIVAALHELQASK